MIRPRPMGVIGLLGGSSDVGTVDYYNRLNRLARARLGGWDIAETLIAGMNFGNIEAFVRAEDWAAMRAYMRPKMQGLLAAGADFILCASNTLNRVAEPLAAELGAPFLHIADPTGAALRTQGFDQALLLGTRQTMRDPYYHDYYRARHGIDIVTPSEVDQIEIDRIIFDELVRGQILPAARDFYVTAIARSGVKAVIMGCTEICLLIGPADTPEHVLFDVNELHCAAAIARALAL